MDYVIGAILPHCFNNTRYLIPPSGECNYPTFSADVIIMACSNNHTKPKTNYNQPIYVIGLLQYFNHNNKHHSSSSVCAYLYLLSTTIN